MFALKSGVNRSFRVILAGSIVLIGFVYLIVFSHSIEGVLNPILLTLCLLFVVIPLRKTNTGVEIPAVFLLLILILTSITSLDPRRSMYQAWLMGVGILMIFYVAQMVRWGIPIGMIWNFLLIIGAGYMLLNWIIAAQWYRIWFVNSNGILIPGISYRLAGGNVTAAYYHGLLMLASAKLISTKKWGQRLLLGFYCLSAVLLIFLSSSRGAYLSVIGGYLVLVFLYRDTIIRVIAPLIRLAIKYWWVSAIFLVLVVSTLGFIGSWYLRNMSSHPTHGPALQSRNEFWSPAIKAFIRRPIYGNGPYTFAIFYMQSASVPPHRIFYHAHNTYLDILSGSGILGLIGAVWFVWVVVRKIWVQYKRNAAFDYAFLGALMAMGAFAVHSIFDGLYLMPVASFNLCVVVGALLGMSNNEARWWNIYQVGIAIVVTVFCWYNLWLTDPYRKGVNAAEDGDLSKAEQLLTVAVARDPSLSLGWQQLGIVRSILALQKNDNHILASAIAAFENAVRLDPFYSANHANLAALYQKSGLKEESVEEWQKAVELSPLSPLYLLNLGELYEELGWRSEAREQYIRVLDLAPAWAEDVFWENSDFRFEVVNQWKMEDGAEISNDRELTEADLLNQPFAEPFFAFIAVKIADQDIATASRMINLAQLAYFQNNEEELELAWLKAELEAAKENWVEAISYGEKALDGFRVQGVYGPGSAGSSMYGSGIYRLNSVKQEIVPQMRTVKFTAKWQERLLRLAIWYEQARDEDHCVWVVNELRQYQPNFQAHFANTPMPCESK